MQDIFQYHKKALFTVPKRTCPFDSQCPNEHFGISGLNAKPIKFHITLKGSQLTSNLAMTIGIQKNVIQFEISKFLNFKKKKVC